MGKAGLTVRRMFKETDTIRDEGLTTPEDVVRFDDILYGTDPQWQVLDVYRPKAFDGQVLPVIINVHGGGWVYGWKETYQYYCMSLAQQGFAVVNYTYRLAPEFAFPASIQDCSTIFQWVKDHAVEYGFDLDHVFALGDSSGAQMLAIYCNILTNPDYARCYEGAIPKESLPLDMLPKAVALNCGVYVMGMDGVSDVLTMRLMREMMPNHGDPDEERMISPIYHVTEAFPPAFVMTCTGDFTAKQAPVLMEALEAKGVQCEYHFFGDEEHELGHVFECNMKMPEAAECNRMQCEWFKRFM